MPKTGISMKAMVLAAGEGTRIREITNGEIPKPMVDLGPGPLLQHTLTLLSDYDIEEIIINLHHEGEKIREFFGEEINETLIHYSEEEKLLGTSGGVKNVENRLNGRFVLIYGDILTDLPLKEFEKYHERKNADITMLTYREESNPEESGILLMDEENKIQEFVEKPGKEKLEEIKQHDFWANGAVFIMEPEILEYIPEGFSDFSKDVFPRILESDLDFYGYPLPEDVYWHEVGNPDRYRKAVEDINSGEIEFKS